MSPSYVVILWMIVHEDSRKINRMNKTTIRTAIQQLEYVSIVGSAQVETIDLLRPS
jgi:hypothetical protein